MDSRCWTPPLPGQEILLYPDGSRITSVQSLERSPIRFHNGTRTTITMKWLNFLGAQVSYGTVEPGKTILIQSFLTHPWTFSSTAGDSPFSDAFLCCNQKRVVFPSCSLSNVVITVAPCKVWTPATHMADFGSHPDFIDQVKTLILGYNELTRRQSDTDEVHDQAGVKLTKKGDGGLESRTGLGSLPEDVVLLIINFLAPAVPDVHCTHPEDMPGRPPQPPPGLAEIRKSLMVEGLQANLILQLVTVAYIKD